MANLFVLCGPPGSGKTTLLQMIRARNPELKQLTRITTRPARPEEGDHGGFSLEYEFLDSEVFADRLSTASVANFIEWNGNLYASDFDDVKRVLQSDRDGLLFEDMPSAVHLRRLLGPRITVILLFTEDEEKLLKLVFARFFTMEQLNPSIIEWRRRLGLKYAQEASRKGEVATKQAEAKYIDSKLRRAMVDLAFMANALRSGEDIRVLANRKDEQEETYRQFRQIVEGVANKTILPGVNRKPKILIIHGHGFDRYELTEWLRTKLGLTDLLIMQQEFGSGRALPEKFESIAEQADGAIAVATPDDVGGVVGGAPELLRARQNIWIEIGWIWGRLGRNKLILLCKGNIEIPSDLHGMERYPYNDSPIEVTESIREFIHQLDQKKRVTVQR
jgi:predicted nucleotide-binding protein/guanylate kinase